MVSEEAAASGTDRNNRAIRIQWKDGGKEERREIEVRQRTKKIVGVLNCPPT
jgi:hypothetical protein